MAPHAPAAKSILDILPIVADRGYNTDVFRSLYACKQLAGDIAYRKRLSSSMLGAKQKSPLQASASGGRTRRVQFWLDCRADINAKDADGATPLMAACVAGHVAVVRQLLAAGAKQLRDHQGVYPLHWAMEACKEHGPACALALIDGGCDAIQWQDPRTGTYPLYFCASQDQVASFQPLVFRLLAEGANPDLGKARGQPGAHTPFSMLLVFGKPIHDEIAVMLLTAGATWKSLPQAVGAGRALPLACNRGLAQAATWLIEHGTDVDDRSLDNTPVLRIALQNQMWSVAELLLSKGAKIVSNDRSLFWLIEDKIEAVPTSTQLQHSWAKDLIWS